MVRSKKRIELFLYIPVLLLLIITLIVFVSNNDKRVYIRKNSSYAVGNMTLNGYSVDSVTSDSNNKNATEFYYYPTDVSLGGGITYSSSCWGQINYNISGLDTNKVYKATANIKTTDLISSTSYGATLGTVRYVTGFSNIVFSWSDSVNKTSEKKVDLYFIPDYNGTATITLGNAVNGYGGSVTGKIEYSNLNIEEATSDDITIYNSQNNKLKMVMRNSDYNKLDSLVNNKKEATQNFINKLEEVYNAYADLAGQNSSGHGLLYPYKGMPSVLMYANTHNYGALAGFPIEFSWDANGQIAEYANNNNIGWGEIHELGHTFDEPLSTLDGYYNTNKKSERMWDFHGEFWANMKAMYVINQGLLKTPDDMYQQFENTYNNSLGRETNKKFEHDALVYLFMQTKNSNGEVDWEAMRKAFKWFNDLESTSFITNKAEKFGWYIKKYNEYRTEGHESIYNVLKRDPEVLDTILNNFSYQEPTYIELWEDKIFLTEEEEYEIDPDYSEDATEASITYESSNPSVATVDDFGNITAISEGKATIKVYSLFNPDLVKTIDVTVNNNIVISFVTNSNETIDDYILKETSTIKLPSLEKEGYTLKAWFSDPDFSDKIGNPGESVEVEESMVLYAKWTKNKYTISFNSNGGSAVNKITAKYKNKITEPEHPTKIGHIFEGWYEDEKLTKPYVFSTMPAKNLVLYAKWIKEEYIINLNSNGGSNIEPIKCYYQDKIEEIASPTKTGYVFDGWYTDNELTNKFNFDNEITNNMTLYAKWTKNKYTISFNSNGGTAVDSIINFYENAVIEPKQPTRVGYTFVGWYEDDLLTKPYVFSTMPAKNIILYAKWAKNKYVINFNSNGGTLINEINAYYEEKVIEAISPIKDGYTFAGWYEDDKLTRKYSFTTMPAKNVTLYAKWNKNEIQKPVEPVVKKYKITFNSNGGSTVNSITRNYKEMIIEPTPPTKKGYTFAGWYEDDKLTRKYSFTLMPAKNIILYAKWTKNKYLISFNSNGGNSIEQVIVEYNSKLPELETPTREGYVFLGWFEDKEFTREHNLKTMPAKDIILYAKWEVSKPEIDGLDNDNNIVLKKRKNSYTLTKYKNTLKLPEYYEIRVKIKDKELLDTDLIPTGSITYVYADGKEVSKYTNIIKGDTNKDGLVTIEDIDEISDYIIKGRGLKEKMQKKAADIIEDNKVKLSDIIAIYEDMEDE